MLQTLEARQRKEKLKEKRKALMAARLAKVRQRKMVNNEEDAGEPFFSTIHNETELFAAMCTCNILDCWVCHGVRNSLCIARGVTFVAEKVENSDEDEDFIGPAVSEAVQSQKPVEPELLTRDETLRRNAPVREWDKGKKGEYGQRNSIPSVFNLIQCSTVLSQSVSQYSFLVFGWSLYNPSSFSKILQRGCIGRNGTLRKAT